MTTTSPSEADLVAAVKTVREAHPALGIVKLWAQLKADRPEWSVSEKRFRKALGAASEGGASASSATAKPKKNELVAQTGLDATLDITAVAPKVKAKMFGGTKGKGVVAKAKIQAGEVLWQEEPWIACLDPGFKPHLAARRLCANCLTQWEQLPPMAVACPGCSDAHFCNRLCLSRARPHASHHELLCEGANPAAREINSLVTAREWRSLDVVARIVARWRGERAWGELGAAEAVEKRVWGGIARVNMEVREAEKADWPTRKDFTTRQWQLGHAALVAALNPPPESKGHKRFAQLLQSKAKGRKVAPLSSDEEARWFSYESFLELLGLVNINMEDSGGLYALHAHLNHSCDPNVQVRNLPKAFVPPSEAQLPAELPGRNPPGVRGTNKLTILARRTIHPGDECTISYVDLSLPWDVRRQALRDGYGFWCECVRCERERVEEEKEAARKATARAAVAQAMANHAEAKKAAKDGVDELAAKVDELAVDDML
ncbi:hypothetical protein VHUM_03879 [Vanrija humicola]|uniref:Histone-lysine N-methyltransferase SET5 n=1 Tax=Vanrija humicola TaxID=5417 RepID=A0A7D8YWB6_VANHU|nr:hypothetical protein VHUM_03879 [Vanrija humicola]